LVIEKFSASVHLIAGGNAVLRRPAFHYVANVYIFFAINVYGSEDFVEQLACSPDKRETGFIFLLTGAFAYDHQFRLSIAARKNDISSRFAQSAPLALCRGASSLLQALKSGCR
jgi:hypothetical protein